MKESSFNELEEIESKIEISLNKLKENEKKLNKYKKMLQNIDKA